MSKNVYEHLYQGNDWNYLWFCEYHITAIFYPSKVLHHKFHKSFRHADPYCQNLVLRNFTVIWYSMIYGIKTVKLSCDSVVCQFTVTFFISLDKSAWSKCIFINVSLQNSAWYFSRLTNNCNAIQMQLYHMNCDFWIN